jgi:hypothetical protein
MAFMNQEKKAKIAAALKAVMPAGWKYSLSVHHHSQIIMTITQAPVDLIAQINEKNKAAAEFHGDHFYPIEGHAQLNHLFLDKAFKDPEVLKVMEAAKTALHSADFYDRSDSQSDYFDVAYYVHMQIGKWDKPFVCVK